MSVRTRQFWLKAFLLGAFLCILIMSIFFLTRPSNFARLPFGNHEISSYRQGFGVFENHRYQNFYNLSPYNDYLVIDGKIQAHWSPDDSDSSVKITFQPSPVHLTTAVLENYFGQPPLTYSFLKDDTSLIYQANQLTPQCLKVVKTLTWPASISPTSIGTALSFNDTDFVFSPTTFQLFSANSQADLDVFSRVYNQELLAPQIYPQTLFLPDVHTLVLKNLDGSGFLLLKIDSPNLLKFDQTNRLIIIESPLSSSSSVSAASPFTLSFTLCSFDTFLDLSQEIHL